jgi:ElaB/YqjD/DUF883 family membrane-anchored ribosome-binding protein
MDTPTPAAGTPPDSRDRIAVGLRRMIDETEQLLKSAVSAGDQKFDEGRIRLQHQLAELRLQLDELEQTALQRTRQATESADQALRRHPYGAIGIAAAVGVLLGLLVARS